MKGNKACRASQRAAVRCKCGMRTWVIAPPRAVDSTELKAPSKFDRVLPLQRYALVDADERVHCTKKSGTAKYEISSLPCLLRRGGDFFIYTHRYSKIIVHNLEEFCYPLLSVKEITLWCPFS